MALACFAANAGGSSLTSSYSLCILVATFIRSARSPDEELVGDIENDPLDVCSKAAGDVKSAANISLVRFAEVRMSS